ncbi:MAG: hypothetical protein ABIV47_13125, partial [Roseiflexaceae bacterium]
EIVTLLRFKTGMPSSLSFNDLAVHLALYRNPFCGRSNTLFAPTCYRYQALVSCFVIWELSHYRQKASG